MIVLACFRFLCRKLHRYKCFKIIAEERVPLVPLEPHVHWILITFVQIVPTIVLTDGRTDGRMPVRTEIDMNFEAETSRPYVCLEVCTIFETGKSNPTSVLECTLFSKV